jgi:hygromycin-B 7''-O-kinase
MRGAREYEFASVGLFVSCGDAGFLRRLLLAYGYRYHQLDDALPRRLLAYALLHRYSDLPWWLAQLPPPPRPRWTHWPPTGGALGELGPESLLCYSMILRP